jgi:hypothetical protein
VWKISGDGDFMCKAVLVLFNEEHHTERFERNVSKQKTYCCIKFTGTVFRIVPGSSE